MSDTLLWLLYLVGGLLAFAAVRYRGWRITVSTVAGAAFATAVWAAWYWLTADEDRLPWFQVQFSLNASFSLIFAAAGAALGAFFVGRDRAG